MSSNIPQEEFNSNRDSMARQIFQNNPIKESAILLLTNRVHREGNIEKDLQSFLLSVVPNECLRSRSLSFIIIPHKSSGTLNLIFTKDLLNLIGGRDTSLNCYPMNPFRFEYANV